MKHDFLNKLVPDDGTEHRWHGYPDECFSFSSFVDSIVALILYDAWGIQPPITVVRKAIIVDFVSNRETQADVSLSHGWNGVWEFPMGVANTVHSRVETNEQNAKISRHLSVIGTAITHEDFFRAVGEKLLDVHSCPDKSHCPICTTRTRRGLTDVFQILAAGMKEAEVHLFAKWVPSKDLIEPLHADGITIIAHPLDAIPSRTLKANCSYHIWDGTEQQAHEFREANWAPSWMKPSDMPLRPAMWNRIIMVDVISSYQNSLTKDLVYGDALGSLVFIPRSRAQDLVEVCKICRTEQTWGAFRRNVSSRMKIETDQWFDANTLPLDNESFSVPEPIKGWPFLQKDQIMLLPKNVLALGTIEETMQSGERLNFPYEAEAEIVRRLLSDGYNVERDDNLVKRACDEIE